MRKIVVLSFITLDGVMQAPGGPDEDPTGGFNYGGWMVGYWDDFLGGVMDEQMAKPFDLLLGRKTYEIFAAYWPYVKSDDPDGTLADRLSTSKKYVASTTLRNLDWSNSTLIKGDTVQEINNLKQQNGPELQVHGSSGRYDTCSFEETVYRWLNCFMLYRVLLHPVVLLHFIRLVDIGLSGHHHRNQNLRISGKNSLND